MSSVLPVYRRSDITIVRGEGVYLFSDDGKRYLDFATGIAVNALGHCHPHVVGALKRQAETLWHCSNLYQMPGLEKLADRLTQASFAERVFFCSSGGEAVECGIKMMRKYHDANDAPNRYRIITMEGGFHGRTIACISAGGNAIARDGFGPLLEGFDRVSFNDLRAVEAAICDTTAGILIEPVQGEGGVHVASAEFLQGVRKLCDKHGILLFLDEVQCGMGRTGKLFAYEYAGITPDIVSVAKGIGNGFPLGACLSTQKAASGMTPGSHGSTYGSNPLAMSVGNAVLDVLLAPGFLDHVAQMGKQLEQGLQMLIKQFPSKLEAVRGKGLILGLKTRDACRPVVEKLRAAGLMTAPAEDNIIRILPPLIIQQEHIDEAVSILTRVCEGT